MEGHSLRVQASVEEERGLAFLSPGQASSRFSLPASLSLQGEEEGHRIQRSPLLLIWKESCCKSQAQDTEQLREASWTLVLRWPVPWPGDCPGGGSLKKPVLRFLSDWLPWSRRQLWQDAFP